MKMPFVNCTECICRKCIRYDACERKNSHCEVCMAPTETCDEYEEREVM